MLEGMGGSGGIFISVLWVHRSAKSVRILDSGIRAGKVQVRAPERPPGPGSAPSVVLRLKTALLSFRIQIDSIAAPSWQVLKARPLSSLLSDCTIKLNGFDWTSWAATRPPRARGPIKAADLIV